MSRYLISEDSLKEFFGQLPILNVDIDLTRRCNLHCLHCFVSAGGTSKDELNTSEFKKVIDDIINLGTIEMTFGGGEPFIRSDAIELIRYASNHGVTCRIVTNGTLLTRGIVTALKELHISVLQVSLDGDEPTHDWFRGVKGSFQSAVRGAELVANAGLPLVINTVVTIENRTSLSKLEPTIQHLHPRIWRIVPSLHFTGRATAGLIHPLLVKDTIALNEYTRMVRRVLHVQVEIILPPALLPSRWRPHEPGCNLLTQCGVMANGSVVPCVGFSMNESFNAGNVRTASLQKIWNESPVFQTIRSSLNRPPTGLCKECGVFETCHGFCRAQSYSVFQRLDMPMPVCKEHAQVGVKTHMNY